MSAEEVDGERAARVGAELAGIAGEAGIGPSELVDDHPSTARTASGGH
ncbi:hypothetical protein [Rhodococcus sp. JS3073]|nr:hypothetical protein [Rhodococcus sp. JS3073]WAM16850.1 hypothetical protein OYT95_09570 [Rhodococcus sp. JS3073]